MDTKGKKLPPLAVEIERRRAMYETLGKVPGGPEWIAASFRASEEVMRQVAEEVKPYDAEMERLRAELAEFHAMAKEAADDELDGLDTRHYGARLAAIHRRTK